MRSCQPTIKDVLFIMPHLSDHDLQQLNKDSINSLSMKSLEELCFKLLKDLMEARDRLKQNPQNSSRPPSSQPPWANSQADADEEVANTVDDGNEAPADMDADLSEQELLSEGTSAADDDNNRGPDIEDANEQSQATNTDTTNSNSGKMAGKQVGAKGFGLKFGTNIQTSEEITHTPSNCSACSKEFPEGTDFQAYTARYQIEIRRPNLGAGLEVIKTKHIHTHGECDCGHITREEPGRCEDEEGWKVQLTEWHMAGPLLVAFIASLAQRNKMSRVRIQEFLLDWLQLHVSIGTINQCIHEAGRALSPVVKGEIMDDVLQAELLYADETSWKEGKTALWLWVFTCATATLFIVGKRTKIMAQKVLCNFSGWLMSDGYCCYRDHEKRLRCWAHLIRKARGLEESLDPQAQQFGERALHVLETIIDSIYQAREHTQSDELDLVTLHFSRLGEFWYFCEKHWDAEHEKTRALAREFCNDWGAIWRVLEDPSLPLTNNEAERALRHWVIARRISYGTRTEEGTTAFTSIASVIDTCYKRKVSPWDYIAQVIKQRRKGLPPPRLPTVA